MKKTSTLLLAALALAMGSCSQQSPATDQAASLGEPHESTINIRYVWRDSITKNYIFAEATRQANEKLETELYAYGNQLQGLVQNAQNNFQQKLQNNGFLTESAAQSEYQKIQQQAANYDKQFAQRQTQTLTEVAANSTALNDSIQHFIVEYNKTHKYDAILFGEDMLYVNPALDITKEVVDGLNATYKTATK